MENRRKPAPPATTLHINCDCKEYVIDYLAKSFPVRLMAVFTDENGNPRSEPMVDEQGQPVLCRSALAARDRTRCGPVAPASGLYLAHVDYSHAISDVEGSDEDEE